LKAEKKEVARTDTKNQSKAAVNQKKTDRVELVTEKEDKVSHITVRHTIFHARRLL
jgi:hypothetical protein